MTVMKTYKRKNESKECKNSKVSQAGKPTNMWTTECMNEQA